LYAPNGNISQNLLRSLRSRLIVNIFLIEIWLKHAKMTFPATFHTFTDFLPPPPPHPNPTPPPPNPPPPKKKQKQTQTTTNNTLHHFSDTEKKTLCV